MRECPWQEPTSNSIATPVLRRSARVAIPFFSATLMVCALLAPALAAAASNGVCAHWCLENFPPGPARGACVSQAAHDTGPCFDCGPAGANTGLCGGICCAGGAICVANACATPTPPSTPTITPTNTSTPTPSDTPTQTPTPSDTPTNTPTATPTDTATDTPTNTPTDTATDTPTSTPTATDTPTITPTAAPTDTPTITPTPSSTPTDTPTATPTEAAPVAVDDTYNNAVGNTLVLVGTTSSFPAVSFTGSVLDNDSDPDNGPSPLSVGTFDATSANGGSVSMNTDGTFTFVPKAGFTGTDTFTYTITDGVKNATATVHIGLSNVVWYVDNSGSNGSGESNAPFNDLAAPQLASQPGDIIFVYHGSSTYSGGISLKNSQQLIGQGVSLVVNGHTLVTGSFAMRPTIGNAVGFGITVASGNTVRGLNVNAQSGITGTAVGDLTTNSVAVTASDGTGVNINGGGTLAVGLDGVSANGMGSATNGIVLSNTAGSFAVAGGTIQNMTGDGIVLTNATNVSLTSMTIASNAHNGINGTAVTGLSLDSCMISNNTNNTNQAGLLLTNLAGTNSVTNTEVSGSTENNVTVANNSGTLTSLMFSNCTIRNNSNALGNVGIRVAGSNTAVMTATIDGCTFDGNRTIALQGDVADTSQLTFSATNNTFTAGTSGNPQGNQGIEVSASQSGQLTFDIEGNNVGTPDGTTPSPLGNTGIDVFAGNTSALSGKVKNNVVINAGAGVSGFGIRLFQNANSTLRANVEGNTVSNVGLDYGILADAAQNTGDPPPGAGQARMDVAVTNNDASVLSGALDAIRVQARKVNTVCAKISGNTTNSGGTGFFGLFARQANTAIFDVEGLALGAQTAAATQASLVTQNPSATTVGTSAATNFTGVASGTCNIP